MYLNTIYGDMVDLLELAKMKIIRHEHLYLINEGMEQEAKVAASGIDEAVDVYMSKTHNHVTSVKEIEKDVIMFAI